MNLREYAEEKKKREESRGLLQDEPDKRKEFSKGYKEPRNMTPFGNILHKVPGHEGNRPVELQVGTFDWIEQVIVSADRYAEEQGKVYEEEDYLSAMVDAAKQGDIGLDLTLAKTFWEAYLKEVEDRNAWDPVDTIMDLF